MVTPFQLGPPMRRQGKRQRAHRPYRQGDLDGLCGVYSVINALRAVCPELTSALSSRLFRQLVRCLRGRSSEPLNAITGGIERPTLEHLMKIAIAFVDRRLGVTVKARRLAKPVRATNRIDRLFRGLSTALSPTSVAIFSVQGRMSHWTVATRVGDKHVFLLDSGHLKRFRRSHCTVGEGEGLHSLTPEEIVIVARQI